MLCALVLQESDAIDRLVKCLAEDTTQSTHRYMARRLREALEKKRQQPECECPGMYWYRCIYIVRWLCDVLVTYQNVLYVSTLLIRLYSNDM